jgi:hypothetical protein
MHSAAAVLGVVSAGMSKVRATGFISSSRRSSLRYNNHPCGAEPIIMVSDRIAATQLLHHDDGSDVSTHPPLSAERRTVELQFLLLHKTNTVVKTTRVLTIRPVSATLESGVWSLDSALESGVISACGGALQQWDALRSASC